MMKVLLIIYSITLCPPDVKLFKLFGKYAKILKEGMMYTFLDMGILAQYKF